MIALLKISLWLAYWAVFVVPFTLCVILFLTLKYLIKKLINNVQVYLDGIHY